MRDYTNFRVVIPDPVKRSEAQNELLKRGWLPNALLQLWGAPDGSHCTLEAAVIKEKLDAPTEVRLF
jgi:hypothetical protein